MDRRNALITKLRSFKKIAWIAGAVMVLALAPRAVQVLRSASLFAPYRNAFESVQRKMDDLAHAEVEARRLQTENASLRLALETVKFECQSGKAEAFTTELGKRLSKETGSRVGRSLAAIQYSIPTHLNARQLHALGISYFRAHDDERAAVIFSFLTGLEGTHGESAFTDGKTFLMAAISWYRLDNYELARFYLDRTLDPKTSSDSTSQAQARLWKGLVSARSGKAAEAQDDLRLLLEHHPKSVEAAWINRSKPLPPSVAEFPPRRSMDMRQAPTEREVTKPRTQPRLVPRPKARKDEVIDLSGASTGSDLAVRATIVMVLIFGIAKAISSYGAQPDPTVSAPGACATLESFAGEVQLLDSSRTRFVATTVNAAIACGSWVSIGKGWAKVRHREGFSVHLGAQTFAEIPFFSPDGKKSGDHVVLYRGKAYGRSGNGNGELRISTSNGRARMKRGSAIVSYDQQSEETQLTALTDAASLENRFEISRRVEVHAGESSSINFKVLRVVPSFAKPVSIASLRPHLSDVQLTQQEQSEALKAAKSRQERRLASTLPPVIPPAPIQDDGRAAHAAEQRTHSRAPASAGLSKHFLRKITGGASTEDGEAVLHPDRAPAKARKVDVELIDADGEKGPIHARREREEAAEKRKLIEELSRVHEE